MSIPKTIMIGCPSCKEQFKTVIFESLNTDFAPNIIEAVISGERFSAKCPHCGFTAHLEYDFLYHDMKHSAMIWVIHKNSPKYAQKIDEIRSIPPVLPYDVTRIVSNMNALREKAACLASGKDDRIIELYKVLLVSQLNRQRPDFAFKNAFYTYHGGKDFVYFYDVNGKEQECNFDRDIYNKVTDLFRKPLLQMEKTQYQVIDFNWAVDFFKHLPIGENEIRAMAAVQSEMPDVPQEKDITPTSNHPGMAPSKGKALFCRKCGAKLMSDSIFCNYCGAKVVY